MGHSNRIYVIKSDGSRVPFDHNKVSRTCVRAGASRKLANIIVNKIARQIHQDIRTGTIYKMVLKALATEEDSHVVRHRYRLKESIMQMGPAGAQFEDYVGRILQSCGFQINSLRSKMRGRCVDHEVDISAYSTQTSKRYMVECKYHNLPGIFTGIKESLYTHARFLDLASYFDAEMLVTNTKGSDDVRTYASCIGQEILSWKYPSERGLEKLIEDNGLYPLTILPLSKKEVLALHENGILISKDLLSNQAELLSQKTGISVTRLKSLQELTRRITA